MLAEANLLDTGLALVVILVFILRFRQLRDMWRAMTQEQRRRTRKLAIRLPVTLILAFLGAGLLLGGLGVFGSQDPALGGLERAAWILFGAAFLWTAFAFMFGTPP